MSGYDRALSVFRWVWWLRNRHKCDWLLTQSRRTRFPWVWAMVICGDLRHGTQVAQTMWWLRQCGDYYNGGAVDVTVTTSLLALLYDVLMSLTWQWQCGYMMKVMWLSVAMLTLQWLPRWHYGIDWWNVAVICACLMPFLWLILSFGYAHQIYHMDNIITTWCSMTQTRSRHCSCLYDWVMLVIYLRHCHWCCRSVWLIWYFGWN